MKKKNMKKILILGLMYTVSIYCSCLVTVNKSYVNKNPLYTASISGDINKVRSLIFESKFDLKDVDSGFSYKDKNYSILPGLAKANIEPVVKKTIFELLISYGANVNAKDYFGLSSLCYLQIKNKSPRIAVSDEANISMIKNSLVAKGAVLSLKEICFLEDYKYLFKRQRIDKLDRKSFESFSDSDSDSGSSESSLENTRKRIMYENLKISKFLSNGY